MQQGSFPLQGEFSIAAWDTALRKGKYLHRQPQAPSLFELLLLDFAANLADNPTAAKSVHRRFQQGCLRRLFCQLADAVPAKATFFRSLNPGVPREQQWEPPKARTGLYCPYQVNFQEGLGQD